MSEKDVQPSMTENALRDALKSVQKRITQAENERGKLEATITLARQEERLLIQLLELRGIRASDSKQKTGTIRTSIGKEGQANTKPKHPLVNAVFEELASAGRPVHISDLMRIVRARGIVIPGSGTQANLISYLRRESQFVRTSRGMYGLAVWGLDDGPTIQRQKRKRVRFTGDNGKGDQTK